MVSKCGVCHQEDSKYRCPRPACELRYCSLGCYKSHKVIHDNEPDSGKGDEIQQRKKDRPGTTQRIPKVDFTGFENDQEFAKLLSRYPLLKVQLQAIYGLTLEPGPDEARTWNRQRLPGSSPSNVQTGGARSRGRGRGRGGFDRGGGRGGRFVMESERQEREHGAWTQAKGDKEALTVMKKMRGDDSQADDMNEGMREFVQLCQMRFGDEVGQSRPGA